MPTRASSLLQEIPGVGAATARDLLRIGIRSVKELRGRDPAAMYLELCARDRRRHDPCVQDAFAAAVHYAETGRARSWWRFTPARKRAARLSARAATSPSASPGTSRAPS